MAVLWLVIQKGLLWGRGYEKSREPSGGVIRSVAPRERLSDHLIQVILTKAEGNPWFLAELTPASWSRRKRGAAY
jgi:hypothetical protein